MPTVVLYGLGARLTLLSGGLPKSYFDFAGYDDTILATAQPPMLKFGICCGGGLAQLGERLNGIQEVVSSNLISSTVAFGP